MRGLNEKHACLLAFQEETQSAGRVKKINLGFMFLGFLVGIPANYNTLPLFSYAIDCN